MNRMRRPMSYKPIVTPLATKYTFLLDFFFVRSNYEIIKLIWTGFIAPHSLPYAYCVCFSFLFFFFVTIRNGALVVLGVFIDTFLRYKDNEFDEFITQLLKLCNLNECCLLFRLYFQWATFNSPRTIDLW